MSYGLSKEKFALLKMVENHKEKLLSLLENDSDFNDIMKSLDGINNCLITHLITSDNKNIGEMSFFHDKSTFVQINDYRVTHYSNGVKHNENGPADYYIDGSSKSWYVNGLCHREDGAAFEGKNGKHWYYKDKRYGYNDDFTIESWKEKVKELKREEKLKIFK